MPPAALDLVIFHNSHALDYMLWSVVNRAVKGQTMQAMKRS